MCMAGLTASAQDMITEKPVGTEKWMHCYSFAHGVSSWGYAESASHDGYARHLVYAEDGSVYIENPVSKVVTDTWVKGTLADGKITIQTPQTVRVTTKDNVETKWELRRLKAETTVADDGTEKVTWVVDKDNTAATFTVTEDGITLDGGADVMLGVCIGDEFTYYGDRDIRMTYVDEESAKMPEGVETETWTMTWGPDDLRFPTMVQIAEANGEMVIKGYWIDQPEATVKGVVDGNKLRIRSGQYVGFLTKSGIGYYTFVNNAKLVRESYMTYYTTLAEDMVLTIDRENNTITPDDPSQNILVKTGRTPGYEYYQFESVVRNPVFKKNTPYGTPEPIKFDSYSHYQKFPNATVPFVKVVFDIVPYDEFGNGFRPEDLRYSVWVDGEKWMFEPDDLPSYTGLTAATDELPLDFENGWGFYYSDYSIFHGREVHIGQMAPEKIGVQTIYVNPANGEKIPSAINYYYPETNEFAIEVPEGVGVDTIVGEAQEAAVIYYDLLGNRVDDTYKGICIKSVVFDNGTVKNSKVVKY